MDPLSGFLELTVAVTTFAVAAYAVYLMVKIGEASGGLPVIGGAIASGAKKIGQAINNAMGFLFGGVAQYVGGAFHAMGVTLSRTWRLIAHTPHVVAEIAHVVGEDIYRLTGLRALVHSVTVLAHSLAHTLVKVGRELQGIEHGIKEFEKEISKGIGEDVLPRIRSLDKELTRLNNVVIPRIDAEAKAAEGTAENALGKIEAIPFPNVDTWAKAVAAGLAALGLDWLTSCRSNPFTGNKEACGLLGDLGHLLGLIAAIELLLNFDQAVHDCQDVAAVTVTGFMDVFGLSNPPVAAATAFDVDSFLAANG